MIKFVVVDDDKNFSSSVKDIIRKVTFNIDEEIKIESFSRFDSNLNKEINNLSERKIYILDIELDGNKSGIQIAEMIRANDWESQIIFMTNHDKMFETVYRKVYEVFDFIEKFHEFETRLTKDLNVILEKNFDNKMFSYKSRNIDLKIYFKNIMYIYRDKEERKVIIVTDNNRYTINMGIQEIIKHLDNNFAIVHRACIANRKRIQKYNWSEKYFVLDNGERVDMLSKKYKKEVLDSDCK